MAECPRSGYTEQPLRCDGLLNRGYRRHPRPPGRGDRPHGEGGGCREGPPPPPGYIKKGTPPVHKVHDPDPLPRALWRSGDLLRHRHRYTEERTQGGEGAGEVSLLRLPRRDEGGAHHPQGSREGGKHHDRGGRPCTGGPTACGGAPGVARISHPDQGGVRRRV